MFFFSLDTKKKIESMLLIISCECNVQFFFFNYLTVKCMWKNEKRNRFDFLGVESEL